MVSTFRAGPETAGGSGGSGKSLRKAVPRQGYPWPGLAPDQRGRALSV